jgi:phospholipid/cholesterol/gamma-HCH transport system permease protein
MAGESSFEARVDGARGELRLAGDCRALDVATLEAALRDWQGAGTRVLDLTGAGRFDIGPAWLLERALARSRADSRAPEVRGALPRHFAYLEQLLRDAGADTRAAAAPPPSWLARFGRRVRERLLAWFDALVYGGALISTAALAWRSIKRLRIPSIVRHAHETGWQAVPVVAVIAFLISVIIAYIGAQQLRKFGARSSSSTWSRLGVLRELGVLLTAIIVAGRSGSAFAAEIGVMKLNDEVDALAATGVNPIEVLVLPRILGLVVALPLLTVIADFMGLAGGALLCALPARHAVAPVPAAAGRGDRADDVLGRSRQGAGVRAADRASGTYRGMQVRGSSRELGRLTTVAVVQSIFLVIFADALFAVLFMELDF